MCFCIKYHFILFNLYDFVIGICFTAIAVQAPASAQAATFVQAASAVKAITAEEDKEFLGEEDEKEYKEEEEEYEDEDEEYEDEDEEEEEVGGHAAPPIAAASLIVPVVRNHNQQRNHVNVNFEGMN